MRTRPGRVEPEVYFRIVDLAEGGGQGTLVADCRKQTIEIALGPKGAFENSGFGTFSCHVSATELMKVALVRQGKPKPPTGSKTPRVTELLRKAIVWRRQLDVGEVRNQAEIALREGITRARVTQVMRLLRLAPEFQDQILSMSDVIRKSAVTERRLRPIINGAEVARQKGAITSLMS